MRTAHSIHYWAAGLLACLVLVAGACKEKGAPPAKSKTPVAQLARMVGEVGHRPAETLVWQQAAQGMGLHDHDAIKTGKGAAATVSFTGARKLKLEIEELSLVIIDAPAESPAAPSKKPRAVRVARVEKGTVRGVIAPGAAPVKVVTPDGETTQIEAAGTEAVPFRLRVNKGGKLEVAVLKGSARVRSGSSEVMLKPQQVVEVGPKQVSQPVDLLPYPVLVAPPVDAKVQAGTEMELRWTPVEGAAMYRVQVSHMVSFSERLYDNTIMGPSFQLPAPRAMQTYVWRVSSVDKAGRESEFGYARRFHVETVQSAIAGQLLHPPDNAGLPFVRGQKNPVAFRWQGEAEQYELVVARAPSLKQGVVARHRVKTTEEVLTTLRSGAYYWGVFGIHGKTRTPLFEKAHRLVITARRPPYVRVPKTIKWHK